MAEPNEPTLTYRLRTWNHYPRSTYFQKLLVKLHPRFTRITGSFADSLQCFNTLRRISDDVRTFTAPPELVVLGNTKFPLHEMVVKSSEEMLTTKPVVGRGPKVVVCYVNVQPLTDNFKKTLHTRLEECIKLAGSNINRLFVFCNVPPAHEDSDIEPLVTLLETTFEFLEREKNIAVYHQLIDQVDEDITDPVSVPSESKHMLGKPIDDALEQDIMDIFYDIVLYLKRFMANPVTFIPESDPVKKIQEIIIHTLTAMLSNDHISKELKETQNSEAAMIDAVCTCIKTACVPELGRQYNLPAWVCNAHLEEEDFEVKVKAALQRETRKMLIDVMYRKTNMEHRVVATEVMNNIEPQMKGLSTAINFASYVVSVMKKMNFEIENYFMHSKANVTKPEKRLKVTPDLRKDIFGIKEVFGVGEVFGELQVHVQNQNNEAIKEVECIMHKHGYHYPYRVVVMSVGPVPFADMLHDNGKSIQAQFPDNAKRRGTLGAFCIDENNPEELYALTCGHVVSNGTSIADKVMIEDTGGTLVLFGTPIADMTNVNTLLDIAAIKVDDSINHRCFRPLKDESGFTRPSRIYGDSPASVADINYPYVYKYGGASRLTFGMVASSNFQHRIREDTMSDCQLLLEPQPDIPPKTFAREGDSGAVVCATVPGNNEIIILSVIFSGQYMIVGDPVPKCLSFMMLRGLQALRAMSQKQLILPRALI